VRQFRFGVRFPVLDDVCSRRSVLGDSRRGVFAVSVRGVLLLEFVYVSAQYPRGQHCGAVLQRVARVPSAHLVARRVLSLQNSARQQRQYEAEEGGDAQGQYELSLSSVEGREYGGDGLWRVESDKAQEL